MIPSGYDYFDHDADIGIIGHGDTVEHAFEAAAAATFAIMADPAEVRPLTEAKIEFEEADLEFALVNWLNLLLATARERGLIFSRFRLSRERNRWRGEAGGEAWRADLSPGVEVKGATLTMLKVERRKDGWEARCVVDV